jgi:hypothetical protein
MQQDEQQPEAAPEVVAEEPAAAATVGEAAPAVTADGATPSGFKQFVARRKESLVNLVRRSSSSATIDASPAASPLFGRKSYAAEPAVSAAEAEADLKATLLKQGPMMVVERKKVWWPSFFACAHRTRSCRSRP